MFHVKNTGQVQWYGYKEALSLGETRIRGVFYDRNNKIESETRIYFSNSPKPKEVGEAVGEVVFPGKAGDYRLVFNLISEGVGDFPFNKNMNVSATLSVHVLDTD